MTETCEICDEEVPNLYIHLGHGVDEHAHSDIGVYNYEDYRREVLYYPDLDEWSEDEIEEEYEELLEERSELKTAKWNILQKNMKRMRELRREFRHGSSESDKKSGMWWFVGAIVVLLILLVMFL